MLTWSVKCDDDEVAKVAKVEAENSTITYINYSNNGLFAGPNKAITNHRVATTQEQQTISHCGGIFRNLQNLIESPKFISPRPICNLRCEYQIVSPYICENEFHVQFLDFGIDSSPNCENDKVIINYTEVLCGKIIGVKKFRTNGGVLNITFSSRNWDLKQEKGFRLLITRLPCIENSKEDQTEVDSLEPSAPEADDSESRCFNVNSSYGVMNPTYGQDRPVYGTPLYGRPIYGPPAPSFNRSIIRGRQDIPVIPLPNPQPPIQPLDPVQPPYYPPYPGPPIGPIFPPIQPPVGPIFPPFQPPILPPQFLPQCCRNNYNQQRFLLISQGFPAHIIRNNDCIFVVQRSSPNVCRLRIIFKYFLLDDPQQGQFGCINNFIEIDGQRICGCKTNFVYETQWGYEPVKYIRMRTLPASFNNGQGFVFDVIQEPCPFKIQQNIQPARQMRHVKSEKFFLQPLFANGQNEQQPKEFGLLPAIKQFKSDIGESFNSKFFQPDQSNFINNVCVMNHLKLFQLKLETLAIAKQYCIPSY